MTADENERLRAVVEAARTLSALLDVMAPHVNNACMVAGIHGVTYQGPTWDAERDALKAALSSEPQARPVVVSAVEGEREACANEIPSSWLDPLLSGPDAALTGGGPWAAQDIETLLRLVKRRIRARPSPAAGGPAETPRA